MEDRNRIYVSYQIPLKDHGSIGDYLSRKPVFTELTIGFNK